MAYKSRLKVLDNDGKTELVMHPETEAAQIVDLQAFVDNTSPFIISATAPTNTSKIWIDNNGIAYFYNGSAWVTIKGTYAD